VSAHRKQVEETLDIIREVCFKGFFLSVMHFTFAMQFMWLDDIHIISERL
jgi:uncharacterized protein (DUF1919 family)